MAEYKSVELTGQLPNLLREPVRRDTSLGEAGRAIADLLNNYAKNVEEEKDLSIVAKLQRGLGTLEQERVDAESALDVDAVYSNAERDRVLNQIQYARNVAEGMPEGDAKQIQLNAYDYSSGVVLQEFNARLMGIEETRAQLRRGSQMRAISLYRQYVADNPLLQQEFSRALNIFKDFQSLNSGLQSDAQRALVEANAEVVTQAITQGTTPEVIRHQQYVAAQRDQAKNRFDAAVVNGNLNGPELSLRLLETAGATLDALVYGEQGLFSVINTLSQLSTKGPVDILQVSQAIDIAKREFEYNFAQRVRDIHDMYARAGRPVAIDTAEINRIRESQLETFKLYEKYVQDGEYLKLKEYLEDTVSTGFLKQVSRYMMGVGDQDIDSFVATMKATGKVDKIVTTFLDARKVAAQALLTLSGGYSNLRTLQQALSLGASANADVTQAMQYIQSQFVTKPQLEQAIFNQLQDPNASIKFMLWLTGKATLSPDEISKYAPTWTYLLKTLGATVPESAEGEGLDLPARSAEIATSNNPTTSAQMANPNSPIHSIVTAEIAKDPKASADTLKKYTMDAEYAIVQVGQNTALLEAIRFDPQTGFSFVPFRYGNVAQPGVQEMMARGVSEDILRSQGVINVTSEGQYNRLSYGLLRSLQNAYTFATQVYGPAEAINVANVLMKRLSGQETEAQQEVAQPQAAAPASVPQAEPQPAQDGADEADFYALPR